jgi:hypothetical protein
MVVLVVMVVVVVMVVIVKRATFALTARALGALLVLDRTVDSVGCLHPLCQCDGHVDDNVQAIVVVHEGLCG